MTGRHPALTLIVVAMALSLAACSATTTPSGSPAASNPATSTPDPSPADSPQPSPTAPPAATEPPSPTDQPVTADIRPDAFALVATDDLRVRTQPFVGDASRMLEPLLWKGAELFVIDGPVAGSGFDWYLVQPLQEVDLQLHPDPPQAGWVAAASKDGEPWIEAFAPDCYATPLDWLPFDFVDPPADLAGLSCFGDRELTFTADLTIDHDGGCEGTTGPWTIEPGWLAPCQATAYRIADADGNIGEDVHDMAVAIDPSVDLAPLASMGEGDALLVDLVGQYSHPAADGCIAKPTGGDGEAPPRPELVVLQCRSQFVVTSLKAHAAS